MSQAIELTVILKDSERTYRHKFLIYDELCLKEDDPTILECIKEAQKHFNAEPDDVIVRTSMVIR